MISRHLKLATIYFVTNLVLFSYILMLQYIIFIQKNVRHLRNEAGEDKHKVSFINC